MPKSYILASSTSKTIFEDRIQTIGMFLLALYPVLFSYVFSFNINYGESFLLIFSFFCLGRSLSLPSGYIFLWIYVAIDTIIISDGFKITYLIPGGISFFIFSFSLAALSSCFNIEKCYRFYRSIFLLSVVVWVCQLLNLLPLEYSRSLILPISDHIGYGEVDLKELILIREEADRASSFFLEPAYYAQFIAIYLALELFYKTGDKKLLSIRAILPVIVLLVLRSGLGVICLIVLILIKFFSFKKTKRSSTALILSIPIAIFIGYLFIQSTYGEDLISRTTEFSEEGSSGYLRVLQGYILYNDLPTLGKVFGQELIGDYMFANGLSTILIRTGIVGLILFLFVYCRLYINGTSLSKSMVILLLTMSLVEQVYLGPSMLICTVIAFSSQKK